MERTASRVHPHLMAAPLTFTFANEHPVRDERGVLLSASDFAALMDEIDSLRRAVARDAVSDAAMDATADELMAALERAGVDRARLDQIAALIERATELEGAITIKGGAGVGSVVRVSDRDGRTSEYELVAQPESGCRREKVALGSPVGRALLGARPGDYVRITPGNGRQRRVRVLAVEPRALGGLRPALTGTSATA